MTDDFGIRTLPNAPPYVLADNVVAGGASIVFRPMARSTDSYLAAALRQEAMAPRPALDKDTATEDDVVALRAHHVGIAAHQVVSLEIAGVDRTADAARFLASLAAARPDAFDLAFLYSQRAESYGEAVPAIDPEPIAGNL